MRFVWELTSRYANWLFLCLIFAGVSVDADTNHRSTIISYKTELVPNFIDQSILGTTTVKFLNSMTAKIRFEFPLNGLSIYRVALNSEPIPFSTDSKKLRIDLKGQRLDETNSLAISYGGRPDAGLIFGEDYLYTAYSTCHWMVCTEEPGLKFPFELHLIVPKTFKVVASGDSVSETAQAGGNVRHVWREDRPYSTYLFGFAAGRFREIRQVHAARLFRFLAVRKTTDHVRRLFGDTARRKHRVTNVRVLGHDEARS